MRGVVFFDIEVLWFERQCAFLKVVCKVVVFAERLCFLLRCGTFCCGYLCEYMHSAPSTVHEANNTRQLLYLPAAPRCVARHEKHRSCLDLLKVFSSRSGLRTSAIQYIAASCLLICTHTQRSAWYLHLLPLSKKYHLSAKSTTFKNALPLKPTTSITKHAQPEINAHHPSIISTTYHVTKTTTS